MLCKLLQMPLGRTSLNILISDLKKLFIHGLERKIMATKL